METKTFQSPCGEEVMKAAEKIAINGDGVEVVSVPLRGRGNERFMQQYRGERDAAAISVPLRGRGDERFHDLVYWWSNATSGFSPLAGKR